MDSLAMKHAKRAGGRLAAVRSASKWFEFHRWWAMTSRAREAVHQEPVWRARANFIIAAETPDGGDAKTEQLWARQLGENRFEICCIPLFLYEIALGDIVTTSPTKDRRYMVAEVAEPSGRYEFRAWFGE